MIKSINMFTPENNNIKRSDKQNFGMAYRIDNHWNEMFTPSKEMEFLSSIKRKVSSGAVKYIGTDGLTYRFKCLDGDILFMKEQKGLMSNVKFVPNNSEKEGFYIINNGGSTVDNSFKDLARVLGGILKRDYKKRVTPIMKHNSMYNVYQRTKRNTTYVYG